MFIALYAEALLTPMIFAKVGIFIYPLTPTRAEHDAYWEKHGEPGREYPRSMELDAWDRNSWDPDGLARLAVETGARMVTMWASVPGPLGCAPGRARAPG